MDFKRRLLSDDDFDWDLECKNFFTTKDAKVSIERLKRLGRVDITKQINDNFKTRETI
jgi:hypothetical protein